MDWPGLFTAVGVVAVVLGVVFVVATILVQVAKRTTANFMKSLPAKVWLGGLGVFFVSLLLFTEEPGWVYAASAAALVANVLSCVGIVAANPNGVPTAALIAMFGKPWRSVGSGLVVTFQPFGIPVERVWKEISLTKRLIPDADSQIDADTADEEVVKIDYACWYQITVAGLFNALTFEGDLERSVNQKVRGLISTEVREIKKVGKKSGRDIVHDTKDDIAARVKVEFDRQYARMFGVELTFSIDDPEVPKDLADARLKAEMQRKENERRQLEMKKFNQMVDAQIKGAEKRGDKISRKEAAEIVQKTLKIIPATITEEKKVFEFGPGIAGVVKELLPALLSKKEKEEPPQESTGDSSAYGSPRPGFNRPKS